MNKLIKQFDLRFEVEKYIDNESFNVIEYISYLEINLDNIWTIIKIYTSSNYLESINLWIKNSLWNDLYINARKKEPIFDKFCYTKNNVDKEIFVGDIKNEKKYKVFIDNLYQYIKNKIILLLKFFENEKLKHLIKQERIKRNF